MIAIRILSGALTALAAALARFSRRRSVKMPSRRRLSRLMST